MLRILAAITLVAVVAGPVMAGDIPAVVQRGVDWTDCYPADPDLKIRGCSNIVAKRDETSLDLAVAYGNRAFAYGLKGDHDRAIGDFDKAISIAATGYDNPEALARTYYNR